MTRAFSDGGRMGLESSSIWRRDVVVSARSSGLERSSNVL